MKKKMWMGLIVLTLLSSGCITIDHEIYLKKDGSGLFLMHITVPNPPSEEAEKEPPMPQSKEKIDIEQIKAAMKEKKLKGIHVEKIEEIKKNDLVQLYLQLSFDTMKDLEHAMSVLYEEGVEKTKKREEPSVLWKISLDEKDAQKELHISYKLNPSLDEAKKKEGEEEEKIGGFEEMGKMMLSTAKVRFALHLPGQIVESNADFVLENQAIWEAALSIFLDRKKTLEMHASFTH